MHCIFKIALITYVSKIDCGQIVKLRFQPFHKGVLLELESLRKKDAPVLPVDKQLDYHPQCSGRLWQNHEAPTEIDMVKKAIITRREVVNALMDDRDLLLELGLCDKTPASSHIGLIIVYSDDGDVPRAQGWRVRYQGGAGADADVKNMTVFRDLLQHLEIPFGRE